MAPHFLHRLCSADGRSRRVRLHLTLIVLSLGTFAYSLVLPAARVASFGDPHPSPVPGLSCLLTSVLYYPSNVFLCAAPLTSWSLRQRRRAGAQIFVGLSALTSLVLVALAPRLQQYANPFVKHVPTTLDIGFHVWLAAHAMCTSALLLPVWQPRGDRAERDALRDEFARLQQKWSRPAPRAS